MAARGEFRFLDGIAPADAAFEATGQDMCAAFEAAARALFSVIVDVGEISTRVKRVVAVQADTLDDLLYNWLSELVCLKDVQRELYGEFSVRIWHNSRWNLEAQIAGDGIDNLQGKTLTDVKAVTYHRLAVESSAEGCRVTVVVDL